MTETDMATEYGVVPPIARALGFEIVAAEFGEVSFSYTPVLDHYNPLGTTTCLLFPL